MNIDPYKTLGINHNASEKEIKKAYKKMCYLTHPDKMKGNEMYFMMVQAAYKTIKHSILEKRKHSNYPKKDTKYENNIKVQNNDLTKNFTTSGFNKLCDEYNDEFSKFDPFMSGGYNVDETLQYQEDIEKLKTANLNIQKRDLIIYKEPEALESCRGLENIYHLGVTHIEDFSCQSGTDYKRAYSEEAEILDTRQKFNDIEELKELRTNQSFKLTREDRKQLKENANKQEKLENLRRVSVNNTDVHYEEICKRINNRLM